LTGSSPRFVGARLITTEGFLHDDARPFLQKTPLTEPWMRGVRQAIAVDLSLHVRQNQEKHLEWCVEKLHCAS
jgi:hypothetical protein